MPVVNSRWSIVDSDSLLDKRPSHTLRDDIGPCSSHRFLPNKPLLLLPPGSRYGFMLLLPSSYAPHSHTHSLAHSLALFPVPVPSLLSPPASAAWSSSSSSYFFLIVTFIIIIFFFFPYHSCHTLSPPATTNKPPARWVLLIPNNRRRPHRLTKPICLCPQSPVLILWQSPPPALFLTIQLMTMGMAVTTITIRVQTARQHCHRGAHHCSSSTSHSSYLYRLQDTFSAS